MRPLSACVTLALCGAMLACGGESVSPEDLDFRAFEVPYEEAADLPQLDAVASSGVVHFTGVLPVSACSSHTLVDATRDGSEVTLVLHITHDPPSQAECPQQPPRLGYEAFVQDVEPGSFSVLVYYTSQLQHRAPGGSVTIDVP